MRILQTGDWHIGKLVHHRHMTLDQRQVLDDVIASVKRNQPDVIVLTGDLYDRSIPPTEAVELLDDVLTTLVLDMKTPVIAISGNHDSGMRIGFASQMMEKEGLYIRSVFSQSISPIRMKDDNGWVNFYPIPFTDVATARFVMQDESIRSFNDIYRVYIAQIAEQMNRDERNVCIAHGYLLGIDESDVSESVRPLTIGGTEWIQADYFHVFDYTALGHIHRPMYAPLGKERQTIRYAGSLMKYSFSEAAHEKSLTYIDLGVKGEHKVWTEALPIHKDMRIIEGELEQLMQPNVVALGSREDYIMARLTDVGELIDPLGKLRQIYPNILKLERLSTGEYNEQKGLDRQQFEKKSPVDLFSAFIDYVSGEPLNASMKTIIEETISQMDMKEEEPS